MKTSILALVAFVCAAIATQASADSFSVANISYGSTNYGYLSAAANTHDNLLIDLHGSGETINGAVFTGGGNSGTGTNGVSYTLTGATSGITGFTSGATDPGVAALTSSFLYGGTPALLTVNGLLPGAVATITVLGASYGSGSVGNRDINETGSLGATVLYHENNGVLSTLTYTALVPISGTLSISSSPVSSGNTEHFYGLTVSQTPEPSSFILCGLGALGLFIAARRRRKA